MKITETFERECCHYRDLKPVLASKVMCAKYYYEFMFCVHCGSRYRYYSGTDASGASEWDYRKEAL